MPAVAAMGRCLSCVIVRINGLRCHEAECPEAWRDEVRECRECGTPFVPESRPQRECDDECRAAYSGW